MDQLIALFNGGNPPEVENRARFLLMQYPDFGPLWNLLGASLRAQGKNGLPALQRAIELSPDDAGAHNNLGQALWGAGQLAAATASFRRAIELKPAFAAAHSNLGGTLHMSGQPDAAVASFRRALEINPGLAEAHCNLGNALRALGEVDKAVASYERALKIKPDFAQAYFNLGDALHDAGRSGEAAVNYRRALQIAPDFAEAYCNLGGALRVLGQLEDAEANCRRALALNPRLAVAHCNLGNALRARGQLDGAVASYRHALALNPDFAEAYSGLGNALLLMGQKDAAAASCRRALELRPDFAEAHCDLGNVLLALGQLDGAIASYRRAIAIKPAFYEALSNLGGTLQDSGQNGAAIECYRKALEINPDYADAYSNLLFGLNYDADKSDEEKFALCAEYETRFGKPCRALWQAHSNSRDAGRRLKVGYVSADFRRHAMAYMAEPIFANHDHGQIETYFYSEVKREDDYTERFRRMADHWHVTLGMSDDAVAQLIRGHQIDILVDLSGHSAGNRLRVFARKPAPLQMTYLGYPATTGLTAMDYRITDRHADPEGTSEARYVERLVRLPDSLWCYRPPTSMPEVTPLPALARGYLTYGSFNNFNKLDRPTIDLWSALLRDQAEARLMLLTVPEGQVRERLLRQFGDQGVDTSRLSFHGKLPLAEFHRKILEADISLDPVTVNGATTTCDSLWLGVPVLSLTGERFLARAGLSILSTIGMAELTGGSVDSFLRAAANLAGNLPYLAQLRSGLRARMAAAPLTDEAGFTRNLETAYRQIWTRWCGAGESNPAT